VTRADETSVPDYPALLRLEDRVFVVIGAGQGIGRQTTHALAAAGARTLCVDIDTELAEEVAAEVAGIPWVGDASSRDDVARLFADAGASLGRIHGVVDIVGMATRYDLLDLDDETWDWQFDIVLRHAMLAPPTLYFARSASAALLRS
jgi:NAD(P)-dependent dehydrogenase (short-subunit alcohol dehydrogenase family)